LISDANNQNQSRILIMKKFFTCIIKMLKYIDW